MIPPFALNIDHKQISATWKMMNWSLTSQGHALASVSELPGLCNFYDSLCPLGILLYC